jgi:TPR repeat protein
MICLAVGLGTSIPAHAAAFNPDEARLLPPALVTNQTLAELKSKALAGDRNSAHLLGRYYLYYRVTCNPNVSSGFKRVDQQELMAALENDEDVRELTLACDANAAIPWLKIAVEGRDPDAMNDLGVAYDELRDNAKSIPWYILAAKAGHAKAQLNLAMALFEGRGDLAEDKALSYFWLCLSENKRTLADAKASFARLWMTMRYRDRRRAEALFQELQNSGVIPPEAIP